MEAFEPAMIGIAAVTGFSEVDHSGLTIVIEHRYTLLKRMTDFIRNQGMPTHSIPFPNMLA
jgi:hypothetical protein